MATPDTPVSSEPAQTEGTLLEAENGTVVGYDASGVVLHLADRVIADIARRLSQGAWPQPAARDAGQPPISQPPPSPASEAGGAAARSAVPLDPAILGDIDAADLTLQDGFYRFLARFPGAADGPRRYLRPVSGGATMAETGGPVLALWGIGGGRLTATWPGPPAFAQHVLATPAPEDKEPSRLAVNLRNRSGESELADALLARRYADYRSLPLIVTGQTLCPPPGDAETLADALGQFGATADRAQALAKALDRNLRVMAIRLDPGFDLAVSDADAVHSGALALMTAVAQSLAGRDIGELRFLLAPDCGAWWQHRADLNRPVLEGLHRLVLRPGPFRVTATAPGYMFAVDDLGQPTAAAMALRADMEAEALDTLIARQEWLCPLLCLAERDGDAIRATFRTQDGLPLILDPADPFGAGDMAGFSLAGTQSRITQVSIADDDPAAVLIQTQGGLAPDASAGPLRLDYAIGGSPRARGAGHPPASGALRDAWAGTARSGAALHRWALPASLEVR